MNKYHLESKQKALAKRKMEEAKILLAKPKLAPLDSFVSLQHIDKVYPNNVQAVYDFNLEIKKHDFVVLVGPSGCGKSTTLRMIAGLEDITCGDLYIDGVYANDLASKDRDIAMVFQSYALYPNMTIEQNMAFGLTTRKVPVPVMDENGEPVLAIDQKIIKEDEATIKEIEHILSQSEYLEQRQIEELNKQLQEVQKDLEYHQTTPTQKYRYKKMSKAEIHERVMKAAKILQIEEYLERKPRALSGGQCQRVALGRAIVRDAKLFLMDEPLSNLDAKLRVQMRSEIIKLHETLGQTTIYVTHDQTEAMTMATKIVVMSKGYIQQIGTPSEIYYYPVNMFVAGFVGSPSMNMIKGVFEKDKISFENGDSVNLNSENSKKIREFFDSEYDRCVKERETIISNFVERNEIAQMIEESQNEEEKEELKAQLEKVEAMDDRLGKLNKAIKSYEESKKSGKYSVFFGIRPENISLDKNVSKETKVIKSKVDVSELNGLEYFVHIVYNNDDFISKIKSKTPISIGDDIELVLDLEASHVFDAVSTKAVY